MTTVSEVINKLRKDGYTEDFNLHQNGLTWGNGKYNVTHQEFVIDRVYRFEGMSDPGDEATVYAISSAVYNVKGVLVNGAGIYTDELTDEMLTALKIARK